MRKFERGKFAKVREAIECNKVEALELDILCLRSCKCMRLGEPEAVDHIGAVRKRLGELNGTESDGIE